MSLIWHIVKKDLRRLAWPLALWLGFGVMRVVMASGLAGSSEAVDNGRGFQSLVYFTATLGLMEAAVGFLLAAGLVMEDSLTSSRAFWPTRPISGGRLLGAKFLGGALMFVGLPILVMAPFWLGWGFSIREIGAAAAEMALLSGSVTMAAFALAAVTATSGQFLVGMLGGLLALSLVFSQLPGAANKDPGLAESRFLMLLLVLAAAPVVVILQQFVTRRTGRTWTLIGGMSAAAVIVAWAWPWDFSPVIYRLASRDVSRDQPQDREVRFELKGAVTGDAPNTSGRRSISLMLASAGTPAGTFVSIDAFSGELAASDKKGTDVYLSRTQTDRNALTNLALEAVGLPPQNLQEGAGWGLSGRVPEGFAGGAGERRVSVRGEIRARVVRARVVLELPLRAGAVARFGSDFTRITQIERTGERVAVTVRERGAGYEGDYTTSAKAAFFNRSAEVEERWVLINRRTGFSQIPRDNQNVAVPTLRVNGLELRRCGLEIAPPMHEVNGRMREVADWEDGAVLVKVRFTAERALVRPWEAGPFVLKAPEAQR